MEFEAIDTMPKNVPVVRLTLTADEMLLLWSLFCEHMPTEAADIVHSDGELKHLQDDDVQVLFDTLGESLGAVCSELELFT